LVQRVSPRLLAAVNRKVPFGQVAIFARPALDRVWAFLRTQPGLRTDGHNIFLYGHPARRGDPMDVDFGVEVVRVFEPSGEIKARASAPIEARLYRVPSSFVCAQKKSCA
jgi:hypothetical protein